MAGRQEQRLNSVEAQGRGRQGKQGHAAHSWRDVKCLSLLDCKLLKAVRRVPYISYFYFGCTGS